MIRALGVGHSPGLVSQVAYLKSENKIPRTRLPDQIATTPQERKAIFRYGGEQCQQLKELTTASVVSRSTDGAGSESKSFAETIDCKTAPNVASANRCAFFESKAATDLSDRCAAVRTIDVEERSFHPI